jgi:hypothetical protein
MCREPGGAARAGRRPAGRAAAPRRRGAGRSSARAAAALRRSRPAASPRRPKARLNAFAGVPPAGIMAGRRAAARPNEAPGDQR